MSTGEIWLVQATADGSDSSLFNFDAGNPDYPDGQVFTFGAFNPGDVSVALYQGIPEPASMAVLGLGLAGSILI